MINLVWCDFASVSPLSAAVGSGNIFSILVKRGFETFRIHCERPFLPFVTQMYKFLYDIPHTRFAINALCFSEDGCILATGDDNGYVRLFDFPLGKESCTLKVATAVTSLQWHPNKSNVIFIGGARGIVTVMNLHTKVSAAVMIPLGSHLISMLSPRLEVFLFVLGLMLQ
jgi:WD40 repeat protein